MNTDVEAAEELLLASGKTVRITVDAAVILLRVSGSMLKHTVAFLQAALAKGAQKDMGRISVRNMVRRGEPFDMLAISRADAALFQQIAKQSGLLYTLGYDPSYGGMDATDGLATILYRQQDAPLVRSILQRCQINTLAEASADPFPDAAQQEPVTPANPTAAQAGMPVQNNTAWADIEQNIPPRQRSGSVTQTQAQKTPPPLTSDEPRRPTRRKTTEKQLNPQQNPADSGIVRQTTDNQQHAALLRRRRESER